LEAQLRARTRLLIVDHTPALRRALGLLLLLAALALAVTAARAVQTIEIAPTASQMW